LDFTNPFLPDPLVYTWAALRESGCRQYEGKAIEMQEAERYRKQKHDSLIKGVAETFEKTYYEIEHGYRRVE